MKINPLLVISFTVIFAYSVLAQEESYFVGETEPIIVRESNEQWESSITSIQRTAQDLLKRNDDLRAQFSLLDKQIRQLESAIALQKRENIRMRHDLEQRAFDMSDEGWIGNLQTKIELKQNEYNRKQKEVIDLRLKIDTEQRAQQLHKLQLEDLKIQQESIQIELQTREEYYGALKLEEHPEIKRLHEQIKEADEQIKNYQQELVKLDDTKVPSALILQNLEAENQALIQAIEKRKKDLEQQRKMQVMNRVQQQKEKYQTQVDLRNKIIDDMADIKNQLAALDQKEKEMLNAKAEEKEPNMNLVREMSRIDATNQMYHDRIESLRENLTVLEENLSVLRQQHASFEKKRLKSK